MYFNCYVYVFLLYVYVSSSCQLALFIYPEWGFSRAFSSVVRQMPGYNPQRRGMARSLPKFWVVLYIVRFVSFCVLFVCKCVLYYCHRLAIQLQLPFVPYHTEHKSFQEIILLVLLATGHLISGPQHCVSYHQAHKVRIMKQDISRYFNWA
jgi:hypothetical protein